MVVCDSGRTIEKRDDFFFKKIYSLGECKSYENIFEKQNFFASGNFYWGLKRVLREKNYVKMRKLIDFETKKIVLKQTRFRRCMIFISIYSLILERISK